MGILDRLKLGKLKDGLAKTRESLVNRVTRLATAKATIDDDLLDQLEEILVSADVGMATTGKIIEAIRARAKQDRYASTAELYDLLKEEIRRQFVRGGDGPETDALALGPARPYVIMVIGINGVGKTTTIGKLAHIYVGSGKKVVIAAADTFRAAANEQLEIWAERAGATLVRQERGSDPAAVAFDAVRSAASQGADVVIIDTAGRLHTKVNLMEELKKIKRVIQKQYPDAPHEVLLVIDGTTGQNGLQQARQFSASVGVTGLVLTKLDGTAKGGIVLAITQDMNVPVRFIGVGEKIDDLQPFDKAAFVDALFAQ